MASPESEILQRNGDGGGDQHDLENDVIEPVTGKRRIGSLHHTFSLPSFFSIVVLVSHSPPRRTVLRCCASKPWRVKKSCAVSLTSAFRRLAPRAAASFSSAPTSMVPAPCPAIAGST